MLQPAFRYVLPALRQVLSIRRYAVAFLLLSIAMASTYAYLLKFSEFELFGPASGLGVSLLVIILSIPLGILFSLTLVVGAYSLARSLKSAVGIGFAALAASVLPSSLCCTAIVPSLLSLAGASTATVIGVTGKIQGPIATLEPIFIAIAFVLMLFGLAYSSKSIYAACCIKGKVAGKRAEKDGKNECNG